MTYIIILTGAAANGSKLSFVLFFLVLLLGIFITWNIIKMIRERSRGSKIMTPTETVKLENLDAGVTIIVLDTEKKFPIIQTVQSYQFGMRKNIFENTLWFDGEGKYALERLKTYTVEKIDPEGTKILNQVSLFITADSIVG